MVYSQPGTFPVLTGVGIIHVNPKFHLMSLRSRLESGITPQMNAPNFLDKERKQKDMSNHKVCCPVSVAQDISLGGGVSVHLSDISYRENWTTFNLKPIS